MTLSSSTGLRRSPSPRPDLTRGLSRSIGFSDNSQAQPSDCVGEKKIASQPMKAKHQQEVPRRHQNHPYSRLQGDHRLPGYRAELGLMLERPTSGVRPNGGASLFTGFSPQPPSKNGSLAISILFEAQEFCYLIPWPPRQHPAKACSTHPPGQFTTAPFSF